MTTRVVISANAERQIAEAIAWWREHREKAPFLLEDELR